MKITELVCSNCGAPLPADFAPNQPLECASCGSAFVITPPADNAVVCPQCRTVNSAEKRFCSSCGEGLKVDCVLCHTQNSVGTVHCLNCGVNLAHARPKRERAQEKRRRFQQERRQRLKAKEARQKEEKLRMLLDALDEPENHEFAIYQINQLGVEAVEALVETLLNDADPDARYGSARALGQICSGHDIKGLIKAKAAKALIQALADPVPAVRYWAVDALCSCKSQAAVEPLVALLKDPHEGVRKRARLALEIIGGERVKDILAKTDKSKSILGWIKGH